MNPQMTEKIEDLLNSSRTHHTADQHAVILIMFDMYRAHALAIRACQEVHGEALRDILFDCWTGVFAHLCVLAGLSRAEQDQVDNHLLSLADAFNVYLSKHD